MSFGERVRDFLNERVFQTAIWKSVFRQGLPKAEKERVLIVLSNIFLHLHPARTSERAVRLHYTWCMGGLSFFSFVVITITGVLLMFYYRPTPEYAYADMQALGEDVPFGIFLRNLHRWAGHAMVILVWLHMLRVFLTGAYKPPRQFNWVVGVSLLTLTMLLSFTGYLLPWDQLSVWAVTVGTNMAGAAPVVGHEGPASGLLRYEDVSIVHPGNDLRYLLLGGQAVGPNALLRFYVLHCVLLPLLTAVLMAVHFWRVRKDGFSASL